MFEIIDDFVNKCFPRMKAICRIHDEYKRHKRSYNLCASNSHGQKEELEKMMYAGIRYNKTKYWFMQRIDVEQDAFLWLKVKGFLK